jgi:hypothetical protein
MTYGFDDADGAADDANATMSGDFGSIMIVNSALDGNYVAGLDETFTSFVKTFIQSCNVVAVSGTVYDHD